MKYFSADYIIPVTSEPIANGVIQLNDEGRLVRIGKQEDFPTVDIQIVKGIILPGFVNAHCHLELSHMQGICDTGTGLVSFITKVVKLRDFEQELILEGIRQRDREMYEAGIQAVGDICNKTDTVSCKDESPIHYYSFIELFDLLQPGMTRDTISNYSRVFESQSDKGLNQKSFVPPAPYSVTPELFAFINEANNAGSVTSIHNQETPDEHELFINGTGGFKTFYEGLGMNLDAFKATGKPSIDYALEHMVPQGNTLFVHNTMSEKEDIQNVLRWNTNSYWVSCPNANLYIENRLPDYRQFMDCNAKMCLGTDSIMSNWQLSIWEEIKTIKKYQSYVPLEALIAWATINGAEALKYDNVLGSLEVGKSPGLVHIELDWKGEETQLEGSVPRRLA